MRQSVQSLVVEFEHDPFSVSRALRDLRDANPEAFEWAAFRSLAETSDCAGTRHLVTLVHEDENLLRRITNPHLLALQEAVRLVNALRQSDPQTEVKLLRMIMPGAEPVADEVTERVLDLIDAVTDSPKLVPVLMQLYRAAPDRIRARLATTIGRHHRNRDWVEERLHDAAWAMGVVRDPRFQKILAQYVKDPDPKVRRRAFPSLGEIKRYQESLKGRTLCQLRFIKLHRASEGLLHILFEVRETESQTAVKGIKPMEVLVYENGKPVFEYQLVERVKYPQPGIYDLHFHSELAKSPPEGTDLSTRMLKVEVVISTETRTGEHSSYWFGE